MTWKAFKNTNWRVGTTIRDEAGKKRKVHAVYLSGYVDAIKTGNTHITETLTYWQITEVIPPKRKGEKGKAK